ncbi:hypothetical protein DW106_08300 [Ruminococcus sp. AM09-18-1]|nr:hypothetical protein DW106_08300 [Ruminococcus sp. AM09-18-1]
MLMPKELEIVEELCSSLSDVKRKKALDNLLFEYRQYMRCGSPEECAQRKEWMEMSYEDILENFNNTVKALQREVSNIRESYTDKKPAKKKVGRPKKKKNDGGSTIYEYLDAVKTSGTELFYLYLRNSLSLTYSQASQNKISRFVSIVRDYDTWRWKELGEDGLVSKRMNDLFRIYGRDKFIELAMKRIMFSTSPLHQDEWFSETDALLLEQKQKEIDIYVEQKAKQITVKTDQWGNTYGVIFAERYFSELGNRLCEMYTELAYIAMIDISRGTISYRTIRDDINLGTEIAHNYGGGGHPKAAGSTFDILWAMDSITDWLFDMQDAESETYMANVVTFENPVRISPDDFVKKYTAIRNDF